MENPGSAIFLFLLGSLFFMSYFFPDAPFLKYLVKFAIVTSLFLADKKRVLVFAVACWGGAFLSGFAYLYKFYSFILHLIH